MKTTTTNSTNLTNITINTPNFSKISTKMPSSVYEDQEIAASLLCLALAQALENSDYALSSSSSSASASSSSSIRSATSSLSARRSPSSSSLREKALAGEKFTFRVSDLFNTKRKSNGVAYMADENGNAVPVTKTKTKESGIVSDENDEVVTYRVRIERNGKRAVDLFSSLFLLIWILSWRCWISLV